MQDLQSHSDGSSSNQNQDLAVLIGANLRRYRTQNNLSLERLARVAHVSRAMLGQIELGKSVPTITVLARIADAFELPIASFIEKQSDTRVTLLPASEAKLLQASGGAFVSRALFPFSGSRKVEFYQLRLNVGCNHESSAHSPATTENLIVAEGELEVTVAQDMYRLNSGDAIFFVADVTHTYRNTGVTPAVAYLVMNYPESISY